MFFQVLSKSHVSSSFPKNEFTKLQNIATKKLTHTNHLWSISNFIEGSYSKTNKYCDNLSQQRQNSNTLMDNSQQMNK